MSAREWFGWICAYTLVCAFAVFLVLLFGHLLATSPPLAWVLFGGLVLLAGAYWGLS